MPDICEIVLTMLGPSAEPPYWLNWPPNAPSRLHVLPSADTHTRPVWRLEQGRAALVAYEIYRGPNNQYRKIPGVLGRS